MQESTFTIPALSPSGLTWHAEGDDDRQSAYYSRKAHVPSSSSGVTIGRGYDLSSKPPGQIISELLSAGVSFRDTLKFSKGSGLKGVAAKSFISNAGLPEITALQEAALFQISTKQALADVVRISEKPDVCALYGKVDFQSLHPAILELLVDLRYRGDYTPRTRRFIQPAAAANDLGEVSRIMANRRLWPNVPLDRFARRAKLLGKAKSDYALHSWKTSQ